MKKLLTFLVLGALMTLGTPSHARVNSLIKQLRTNASAKVRLLAVLQLSRYNSSKVRRALIKALRSDRDNKVRGFAAMALGRLGASEAASALKTAARSSNGFLRSKARKALERLCPSSLSGKKFYITVVDAKGTGPSGSLARGIMLRKFNSLLSRRSDVTTGWPSCRKPSRSALRRKRIQGFGVDLSVKVSGDGGRVSCKVNILFSTYPGSSIKGNAGARAAVPGSVSGSTLSSLIGALVDSLNADVNQFLNRQ